ncbi:Uncharacterised protein [Candidatus Burarchaeum australiense]|nr:Uncharacterised protein [Candidatus Burarchaeum australiense]
MVNVPGIFYSGAVAIIVVVLALHLVSYMDAVRTQSEAVSIRIRTNELANFMEAITLDMPRAVDISSRRALVAAINEVDVRGSGLDDAQFRLYELVINGTIYGIPSYWMNASTVPNWAQRVEQIGATRGFITNISLEEFSILPYDSFDLMAHMQWSVNVTESTGKMSVHRYYNTTVIIPITGFDDPLYTLQTHGLAKRKIIRSNFTTYNLTYFDIVVGEGLYVNRSEAPSFLDRLENNLVVPSKYNLQTGSQIGLESVVNVVELANYDIAVNLNQTMIDHLYFGDVNITSYAVNGSEYDWVRIDQEHADFYNLGGLLVPG